MPEPCPPDDPPRWRDLFTGGGGRVLAFCWLGWVFDFYDLILFAFVKGAVGTELGLRVETDLAWVDGATLLATAAGGFGLGRYADRRGRRPAMVLGIVLFSAGTLSTAFAHDFVSLLAARLLTGFGVGGEWGVAHAVIAETFRGRTRLRAAALLQTGAPVAMALAAVVGCLVAPHVGWRTCFSVSASTALLAALARWMLPASPARAAASPGGLRVLCQPPYRRASVGLLVLLVLHMTGFWCTYAWLPVALMRELKVALPDVAWFQIQVNAVHVVADLAYPVLAERWGRRRVFRLTCLVFALGLVALAMSFGTAARDWRAFGWAAAAVGLGAGTWSAFGPMFAANYPPGLRATAASGFYNLARGSQLLTQPLVGWLALRTGTLTVGLWIGAATAVASAWALALVPRTAPGDDRGGEPRPDAPA